MVIVVVNLTSKSKLHVSMHYTLFPLRYAHFDHAYLIITAEKLYSDREVFNKIALSVQISNG